MESEEVIIQKEKIEVSPKMMGKDFKKFIKTNSDDYLERLKAEIFKNFKIYYESLNERGDLLNEMQDKAKDLESDSYTYKNNAIKVRKTECCKKATYIGIICGVVAAIVLIVVLVVVFKNKK